MTKKSYTSIKSFEDAMAATGRPNVPEFADAPGDMREYLQAQYKAIVITEAINGDWKADYNDGNQKKWIPWFYNTSSGFVCDSADWANTSAGAGHASRLCFETQAQAQYAGETFLDIFVQVLTK